MKSFKTLFIVFFLAVAASSCSKEDLDSVLNNSGELSDSEVVEGLKVALNTGTDSSSARLSMSDGYYKDALVKILLPDQIENTLNTFKQKQFSIPVLGSVTGKQIYESGYSPLGISSLQSKETELILGINRAAELAAKTAGPIFKDAIVQMSFTDAKNILNGPDTAATSYLKGATRAALFKKYEPIIDSALNTVKVGNISVAKAYENYIADYNSIVNTKVDPTGFVSNETLGSLGNIKTVQVTDLSNYSTGKGLDGLFLKVADEEKKIRDNPYAYVSAILQKVFGSLKK